MARDYVKLIDFSKDGKTLTRFPRGYQGEYVVPEGVTAISLETIEYDVLTDCESLSHLHIPSGVKEIGQSILTEVRLPAGSVKINETAFKGCPVEKNI